MELVDPLDARQLLLLGMPLVTTWENAFPARSVAKSRRVFEGSKHVAYLTSTRYIYVRCPFHDEKSPSLRLSKFPNPRWHCFGCGQHGTVLDLLNVIWT